MKKIILASILTAVSVTANAASVYDCSGGSFDPLKVDVHSTDRIVLNDKDLAKVDSKELANSSKKSVRLIGSFPSLGDGLEGFRVDVKVTRFLLNGSKMAFLNTFNKGPQGYYTESYKCIKR